MAYRRLIITTKQTAKIKSDLESLFNRVGHDFPDVKTNIVSGVKPDTIVVDLNGDGADSFAYKVNDIAKKHGAQVKIKKEKSLAIKEERVTFKSNGTARDLYKILQKDNSAQIFANGTYYAVDINDLKADINSTDCIYGVEKDGKETMINLSDIEFIETYPKKSEMFPGTHKALAGLTIRKEIKEGDENTPINNSTANHNDFGFKKLPDHTIEFYTNNGKKLLGTLIHGDYYISTTGIKEAAFIQIALNMLHIPTKKESVHESGPNLVLSGTSLFKLLYALKKSQGGKLKEGTYGYDDDFDEGPQPGDAEYHYPKQTKQTGLSKLNKGKKETFLLYTNPNNHTNRAYVVIGSSKVRDVLKSAKQYQGSYDILYQGKGTNDDLQKAKQRFNTYKFGEGSIIEGIDTTPATPKVKPVLSREKTFANAWSELLVTLLKDTDGMIPFKTWELRIGKNAEIGKENAAILAKDLAAIYKTEKGPRFKQTIQTKIIKVLHNEKIT